MNNESNPQGTFFLKISKNKLSLSLKLTLKYNARSRVPRPTDQLLREKQNVFSARPRKRLILRLKCMQKKFVLKNDKYRKTRGGYSRFINIFCHNCKKHLLLYQKDGPGALKRIYLDRIFAPKIFTPKTCDFICPACKKIIGKFYTYKNEKRLAIRLHQGSFFKKIGKGSYPPH